MSAESTQSAMPAKRSVHEHRKYQNELDVRIEEKRATLLEMAQSDAPIQEVRALFLAVSQDVMEKYQSVMAMLEEQKENMAPDIFEHRMEGVKNELEYTITEMAVGVDHLIENRT